MFGFVVSVSTLSAVVLGGMGNVVGVGIGAFVIYLIQSIFLKQLNILFAQLSIPLLKDIDFLQFQYVLYGAALVIMGDLPEIEADLHRLASLLPRQIGRAHV